MTSLLTETDLRGELRRISLVRNGCAIDRVYWSGEPWQLGTAAFWEDLAKSVPPIDVLKLGSDLAEEIGICLLGGYGVRKASADAAFARLRDAGAFRADCGLSVEQLSSLLSEDLSAWGFAGRYRFPQQKAARLFAARSALAARNVPADDLELREYLEEIPGIGRKTASWIVRNERASTRVAVIDVHLVRAGIAAGVFDPTWRLPRDYESFEGAFLAWSLDGGVAPTHLDSCIWGYLSRVGNGARDLFGVMKLDDAPIPVWPSDRVPLQGGTSYPSTTVQIGGQ